MVSAINEAQRSTEILASANDQANAAKALDSFLSLVASSKARRLAYEALENDPVRLEATREDIASRIRVLVDAKKSTLKTALTDLANVMRDVNGNPLTLQNLLDEIAGA